MTLMGFNIDNSDKYTDNSFEREYNSYMDIITKDGRKQVVDKITELKKRKSGISERIGVAREQGGVEENEELHMALEEMQRNDVEIERMSKILADCTLLNELPAGKYTKVVPGVTVRLENFTVDKIVEYTIFGEVESDPSKGIISFKSPLGVELMNAKVGDEIELDRGTTTIEYEILDIFVK